MELLAAISWVECVTEKIKKMHYLPSLLTSMLESAVKPDAA